MEIDKLTNNNGKLTKEDFDKLSKRELYEIWYNNCKTDKQIAKMYNISRKEVKSTRKKFNMTMFKCAMLKLANKEKYSKMK